jgi:hypothetical protein
MMMRMMSRVEKCQIKETRLGGNESMGRGKLTSYVDGC